MTTATAHNAPLGPAWARWVTSAVLLLSAGVLLASLTVALYNVRYSYHRILDIASGAMETPAVPEVLSIPAWVAPFLQDLSVVSPGVVAFTAGCMTFSAALLLWFPASVRAFASPHFPFPRNYRTYYVQFGLIGTLIGFVMAFSDIDLRAERQAIILLEALGTAVWSSLTAILLAYGVCPIVEVVYQRLQQPGVHPAADTRSALEALRRRTVDAAESLAMLRDSANALGAELSMRHVETRVGRLEGTLSEVADRLAQLARMAQDLAAARDEAEGHARRIESQARAAEERLSSVDAQVRDLAEAVSGIKAAVGRIEGVAGPQREQVAALEKRVVTIVQTLKKASE
jgi:hypothetical protein